MPLETIKQKALVALNALDCPDGELSIVLTDDPQIQELNREYLHRDRATNVMAFPMLEGEFQDITPSLLGDVVISVETANKEAQMADMSFMERFDQLLIHGILHLFGYDHEHDEQKAAEMEDKAAELLTLISGM
ncbi:MAG: rRNA maturation RNase YbeY [Proteobacteria bacterium]|nr:rRNA maturation RNase YbeY [Pseudomonadota bacterium]